MLSEIAKTTTSLQWQIIQQHCWLRIYSVGHGRRRRRSSIGYFVDLVHQQQHAWLRHVLRMEGKKLPKTSIQARSHNTYTHRGRPHKYWVDVMLSVLELTISSHSPGIQQKRVVTLHAWNLRPFDRRLKKEEEETDGLINI
jgi:hypothetical protein